MIQRLNNEPQEVQKWEYFEAQLKAGYMITDTWELMPSLCDEQHSLKGWIIK